MEWIGKLLMTLLDSGAGIELTRLNSIDFQSWIPFWALPFLAAGIALAVTWLYHRAAPRVSRGKRIALISLRTAALIGLLTCLVRPELVIEGEGVRSGPVPVILDGTQSMNIRDVADLERTEAAKERVNRMLEEGGDEKALDLQSYWAGRNFDEYFPSVPVLADGDETSIAGMLERGITPYLGEYLPGMVLLTDGAHNTPQSVERMIRVLRKRRVPVYTVGVGTAKADDVAVTYLVGDDVVFLTEKAKTFVNLQQSGYDGQKVRVRVFLDEQEVYEGEHELRPGETSVPVEYQPYANGTFQLRAEVEPLAGEITEENNTYLRTVRVIDEEMRILMVFGLPTWEYRYLEGAFERDKRVAVDVYMPSVDSRLFTQGDGRNFLQELPKDAQELGENYDAVFLSALPLNDLPEGFVKALPEFVENAGGLAVISDPTYIPYTLADSPLAPLLPIVPGREVGRTYRDELFNPRKEPATFDLTDDGEANPMVLFSGSPEENREIWQSLPPIYQYYPGGRLKPSALTLLVTFETEDGQQHPAIVLQTYGKGSVLFMGFDSTWRWRREFGDRYFRGFWGKAVQYLALPHLLNEAAQSVILAGQETAYTGERMNIRARLSNADFSPYTGSGPVLTLRGEDFRREVEMTPTPGRPGIYRAEYMPDRSGTLELSLPDRFNAKPLELRVMTQQREFRNAELNRTLLEQIADGTGGLYRDLEDSDALLEELLANRPRQPMRFARSLWDTPLLLLLILFLLTAEWILRKSVYLD